MTKARMGVGLLAGCLLCWSGMAPVGAAPTPAVSQMLGFRPRQEGIVYSIPSTQEMDACKVELVTGAKGGSGWLLRDSHGLPLRRFYDVNGDKKVDVWSYYSEGVEVYREISTRMNGKVDQYRWLNSAGCKWGVDINDDAKIDSWKVISAEEVSQEVLQAFILRDFNRLQALFITDAEMKSLELPVAEVNRIHQIQAKAATKFQSAVGALTALSTKTHWVRLEANLPQCVPADQNGSGHDLVKYVRGTILYENNGKHEFMQMGEWIEVGSAWRVIEALSDEEGNSSKKASPDLQKGLDELTKLDATAPKTTEPNGASPEVVRYNMQRADLIQRIIPLDEKEKQEFWLRQIAECYSAAAQSSAAGDRSAYDRLLLQEKQVCKDFAGSTLAAFVTFREMQAENAMKLALIKNPDEFPKVQAQWLERLTQYVQSYPKGEDAPDALMQLGMVSEFVNRDIEAKNWYARLVKEFPEHPLTLKAKGALARLEIEGKPLELVGPMRGSNTSFNISSLRGKMVVVYYWASWNQQSVGDFARLKLLQTTYGSKGLEIVCINLENGPPEAGTQIAAPGICLFQGGGLESPLATQYGIFSLPHLFFLDREGKVVSRTLQIGNLEDEVKKQLK